MENTPEKKAPEAPKPKDTITVTSSKTIDFPSLGWSIRAGEEKEIPAGIDAQVILAHNYITKKE